MLEVLFVFLPINPDHLLTRLLDFYIKMLLFALSFHYGSPWKRSCYPKQASSAIRHWGFCLHSQWKQRNGVDAMATHGFNLPGVCHNIVDRNQCWYRSFSKWVGGKDKTKLTVPQETMRGGKEIIPHWHWWLQPTEPTIWGFLDVPCLTLTEFLLMQVNAPLSYNQLPLPQDFLSSRYSSHFWRVLLNFICQTVTKQNKIPFDTYLGFGAWKWMNFPWSSPAFLTLSVWTFLECQSLHLLGTASSTLDSTIISWATSLWHNKNKKLQEIKIKSHNVFTQVP